MPSDYRWWYTCFWRSLTISRSNFQLKIYTWKWTDHLASCSIGSSPVSQEYNSVINQLSYIVLQFWHFFPCGPSSCPCPQATCHSESPLPLIIAQWRSSIITINQNVLFTFAASLKNSYFYDTHETVCLPSPLSIRTPEQISKVGSALIVSFYLTACSFHIAPCRC